MRYPLFINKNWSKSSDNKKTNLCDVFVTDESAVKFGADQLKFARREVLRLPVDVVDVTQNVLVVVDLIRTWTTQNKSIKQN